jgi:hypothetical protein
MKRIGSIGIGSVSAPMLTAMPARFGALYVIAVLTAGAPQLAG